MTASYHLRVLGLLEDLVGGEVFGNWDGDGDVQTRGGEGRSAASSTMLRCSKSS